MRPFERPGQAEPAGKNLVPASRVVYALLVGVPEPDGPKLLTIKVAAGPLGVSERTLRRWDETGKL